MMLLFFGITCISFGVLDIVIATNPFGYVLGGWCLAVGVIDIISFIVKHFVDRR